MSCRSAIERLSIDDLSLQIRFNDLLGRPITTLSTRFNPIDGNPRLDGVEEFRCHVPSLELEPDTTPAVAGFNLRFRTIARAAWTLALASSLGEDRPGRGDPGVG